MVSKVKPKKAVTGVSDTSEKKGNKKKNKKVFLLDTNVLVYDPKSIYSFDGAEVALPSIVLEELDKFKREGTDRGRNAREAIRILDGLRAKGSLGDGVPLGNGGTVRVIFLPEKTIANFPFKLSIQDNEILYDAVGLKNEGNDVTFITKDLNVRVKADALGILTDDYIKEHINIDEFYKGWMRVAVPAVTLTDNDPKILHELAKDTDLAVNEYVLLESQHNAFNYRVFRYVGNDRFISVREPLLRWPLRPRNAQQLMAMDLLLNDDIKLVTLFGPAGTGKTFLALLVGLHKVLIEDIYEKMLVARPVVPLGKDIGYLPGDLQEKLYSWMLPIYDNMDLIVHSAGVRRHQAVIDEEQHGKNKKHKGPGKKEHKREGAIDSLDHLIKKGKISLEAITYMRGRSIPYQYIIIDEVQNLTPHEVKTLITRVGEGSKIILAGDPYQIDSPYLDFSSNGLVVASQRFKGERLFGSVYLESSERSELSKLGSELM
jgi:PhoH-like ATPase